MKLSYAEFRQEGCPSRFQKIYRGIQGFCTSLADIGPITSMLEDEQSLSMGDDCYCKYYVA
jgi:hypothetical protein